MVLVDDIASLARRAIAGDTAACEQLLRQLQPLVVRTVRLIVGPGSWVAEDAAQDALLDIARNISTLREPRAVRAWALRVATQRAIKVSRRERLLWLRRSKQVDPELMVDPEVGRTAAVSEAFGLLPPAQRATAVLRLYAGLSEEETASALGCSVGTIKSNLHDARQRLAQTLRERGFAPSTIAKEVGST
jgi:RNA polymerase sigma-70 factor (ECF subfamily)